MLDKVRNISYERKQVLTAIGLYNPTGEASSDRTVYDRMAQIQECIDKLQAVTDSRISLIQSFTMRTIKKDADTYELVREHLHSKFVDDFNKDMTDFHNDYVRQTNEAFLNVLNNFSERSHHNARKQINMTKKILVNEQGLPQFDKASNTIIQGVKIQSGNSRDKTKQILDDIYAQIEQISPWDDTSFILMKRDAVAAITVLFKTFFDSKMVGRYSEFNRASVSRNDDVKQADNEIAQTLGISINDSYLLFPKIVWLIAKGDEASGVKKLPVEYRKKVLYFFWSAILMSNDLSQSRHAAVATVVSGLTSTSSLVIDTIQDQV